MPAEKQVTAEDLAKGQREISISEFFVKNKHLLGFDNPRKALLTTIKEACDNSLTYDMPILVRKKGKISLTKIGELIDTELKKNKTKICISRDGGLEKITAQESIEALAFDKKTLKLSFHPVSTLFRHKVNSKIYRVKLTSGRYVDLTAYHSVFTIDKGEVISVPTTALKVGTPLIVPRSSWNSDYTMSEINLIEELLMLDPELTKKIYIHGINNILTDDVINQLKGIFPESRKYRINDFKRFNYLPFNTLRKLKIDINRLSDSRLGYLYSPHKIPVIINADNKLAELLGFYASEGSMLRSLNRIHFSFGDHEKEMVNYLADLFEKIFKVHPKIKKAHNTAYNVISNSSIICFVFKHIFKVGDYANSKKIPEIVHSFSYNLKYTFLLAYLSGDGYPSKELFKLLRHKGILPELSIEKITCATASSELFIGLQYLLSSLGLSYSTGMTNESERIINNIKTKYGKSYQIYVYTSGKDSHLNLLPIKDTIIGTTDSKLRYSINRDNQINLSFKVLKTGLSAQNISVYRNVKTLLESDLGVLRIRSIEEIQYDREWVYDVSVPNCENFVAGVGAILCHNSLDAAEEARIVPEIKVEIKPVSEDRFIVIVEDNGPGIVKEQIPRIFAKLLYGSKFHRLRCSRGQQGIGICMTPDTLITLGDGKVLSIENIVEEKPNADLFVLTPTFKFGLGKIDRFWKIPSPPYMVKLDVLRGRSIQLTPENPVLVIDEGGYKWKDADDISEGEHIAVAKKLGTHVKDCKIPLFDFLDEEVRIDNSEFIGTILENLKKKYKNWNSVAKRFNIKKDQIKGWKKTYIRRRPNKKILELFADDLGISKEELIKNCTRVGKLGTYITLPNYIDDSFMRFLGFISGDGHSQKESANRWGRNISFWNNNAHLIREFRKIAKNLFGLKARTIIHSKGRGQMAQFSSSLVSRIINKCGVPSGKKHNTFRLIPLLHRKDLLRPYLQALFDCEAHVSKDRKTVSFMIRNDAMISYINMFLLQFGVVGRINKAGEDKRIVISGIENICNFNKEIGFSHPKKKNILKEIVEGYNNGSRETELIPFIRKKIFSLKNKLKIPYKEFPTPQVICHKNKSVDMTTLQGIVNFFISKTDLKKPPIELQELYCLLNSNVTWTKVTSKKRVEKRHNYVYDLTMAQGNNFVANGIIVHNSASCMYGQLTTGKPAKITSKTNPKKLAHYFELIIDTKTNEPKIVQEHDLDWPEKKTGTKVEIELTAKYQKGNQSVDQYLKQTAIVNPHLSLTYINPEGEKSEFPRATNQLPKESKEIKPHPHGIELGILIKMLHDTQAKTLQSFLQNDFCRISAKVAKDVCEKSSLDCGARPERIAMQEAEILYKSLNATKIMSPPTDCVTPIGEELIIKGLKKEVGAEFYTAVSRPPSVYRGNPFIIEVGLAYRGNLPSDELVKIYRFANRVPLLYQLSACATTKAVVSTTWRNYGLSQSKGALPAGPVVILIHVASVWVPFTSESKEAIAHYPEILKELKLALQEVGRKLATHIRKNVRAKEQRERANLFEKYIPELASSLSILSGEKKEVIKENLEKKLKKELPLLLGEVKQAKNEKDTDKE